jgi:DNA-nicking Smr family endonuclease
MSGGLKFLKVGDRVGFLYEIGGGIIRKIENNQLYIVEDEDGFERPFRANELVEIHGTDFKLPDDAVAQINDDDTISEKHYISRKEIRTGSRKAIDIWEIDLHIESLVDSHAGMSNAEILTIQLKELRNFYHKAREKHIRKLVIIHGVGEGILRSEVRMFLGKKDGLEFYDADFRDYGKGATAVDLFYNF